MKKVSFTILGLLLFISLLIFANWSLTPTVPTSSSIKDVLDGQESYANHLEIGLLYEQNGLLSEAQSEYVKASEAEQEEIAVAAQNGLNRFLRQMQDPWLTLQNSVRTFLQWIGENLLRLLLIGVVAWLIWLLVARLPRRSGYLLMPFQDFTRDSLGEGLHAFIYQTFQETKCIYKKEQVELISSSESLEVPMVTTLSGEQAVIDDALSILDSFSVGGIDFPLGKTLLAVRRWASTAEYTLSGSLHQHGQVISLSAEIRRVGTGEVLQTWELSTTAKDAPADQIATLAKALTFQILFYLSPNLEARNWHSLQLFTMALKEKQRYGNELMDRVTLNNAADILSEALILDPGYTSAHYLLGVILSSLGRYREARDAFREVIDCGDRLEMEATYNLGLAFYHEFQDWAYRQAITQFANVQKALTTGRQDMQDKLLLALAHCGLASAHAQRVKSADLGKTNEDTQDPMALVELHCHNALDLVGIQKIRAATHNARGIAYLKLGQIEDAEGELKTAIQARPDYAVPYVYLAQAYADDESDKAIHWLERAVKWHPGYEYAYFQLGKIYQQQQKTQAAKQAYTRAVNIPDAHNTLGEIWASEGEYEDALAEFHEVVRLNSRHSRGWRNLAWWTIESGERNEEALKQATAWARRSLELDRGTSYEWLSYDALGRVLCYRGRLDQAEEAFLASILAEKGRKHIQNRFHLASLYHQRSEIEQSRQTLIEALELHEQGYWRDKAVTLMKELSPESP